MIKGIEEIDIEPAKVASDDFTVSVVGLTREKVDLSQSFTPGSTPTPDSWFGDRRDHVYVLTEDITDPEAKPFFLVDHVATGTCWLTDGEKFWSVRYFRGRGSQPELTAPYDDSHLARIPEGTTMAIKEAIKRYASDGNT